ncbi:TetR family transcriptional regulator [Rathayibacter sp. KR2-224]|uniref:TetR family transcriptional regulator n=1 Tax=Rathayibacter sp. KR2-224 TaxID=3400913 RepID=UPI003C0D63D2
MVGRPIDHQRRAQLLDAVVEYTIANGLAELSLRPAASALGVSTATLVHHFGTKEQLLQAVLARLRERILQSTTHALGEQHDLATAARAVWKRTSDRSRADEFRLFFAVYGRALQAPDEFEVFLEHVVADWRSALETAQPPTTDRATATRRATLVIATIRGLLLDLLATGDHERVQEAAEGFFQTLESRRRSDSA